MLRLRWESDSRFCHCCSVGQRAYLRRTLTAGGSTSRPPMSTPIVAQSVARPASPALCISSAQACQAFRCSTPKPLTLTLGKGMAPHMYPRGHRPFPACYIRSIRAERFPTSRARASAVLAAYLPSICRDFQPARRISSSSFRTSCCSARTCGSRVSLPARSQSRLSSTSTHWQPQRERPARHLTRACAGQAV